MSNLHKEVETIVKVMWEKCKKKIQLLKETKMLSYNSYIIKALSEKLPAL